MRGGFIFNVSRNQEGRFPLRRLDRQALARLGRYLRPHLGSLVWSLVAMSLVSASTVAEPLLIKSALDHHILPGEWYGLVPLLLIYLAFLTAGWVGAYWQSLLSGQVGQKVVAQLREDLFDHLQVLSLDFFARERTGGIVTPLTHGVNNLADLVSQGIVNLAADLLTMGAMMGVMLWLAPDLALVAFVTIPLILGSSIFFGQRLRRAYHQVQERLASLNTRVQENLSGMRVIQSLTREEETQQQFRRLNWESLRANLQATALFALYFPSVTVTGSLGTALVLWYGGIQVMTGEATPGLLVAFITYLRRFFNPLRELSQIFNTYQTAAAALDRISHLMAQEPSAPEPREPELPPAGFRGEVECSGVFFAYPDGYPVLRDLNLHLAPGSSLALVGPSGSGKTTLARLLLRLYDPDQGSISLDGVNLNQLPRSALLETVTMVPQEPFILADTLEENLRVACPAASRYQLEQTLRCAGLEQLLEELPQGLDTWLGTAGITLSGGQREMVGLARALLRHARVIILDEPTSHLDPLTEASVHRGLQELLQDRTALIIAHRPQTAALAEKVALLEEGSIQLLGTWELLQEDQGRLARLLAPGIPGREQNIIPKE